MDFLQASPRGGAEADFEALLARTITSAIEYSHGYTRGRTSRAGNKGEVFMVVSDAALVDNLDRKSAGIYNESRWSEWLEVRETIGGDDAIVCSAYPMARLEIRRNHGRNRRLLAVTSTYTTWMYINTASPLISRRPVYDLSMTSRLVDPIV